MLEMTRSGIVSSKPSPVQAMDRELDARYAQLMSTHPDSPEHQQYKSECHGLAVALSICRCLPMNEVSSLAHARYLGNQTQPG